MVGSQRGISDDELEHNVFKYFGIMRINDPVIFNHAARRNYAEDLSSSQEAWLFRVHKLASALQVTRYSEEQLRTGVGYLELLMTDREEIRHATHS